jgi:hypothetical protein
MQVPWIKGPSPGSSPGHRGLPISRTECEITFVYGWRRGELLGLRARQLERKPAEGVSASGNRSHQRPGQRLKMKTLLNLRDRSEVLDRLANVRPDTQPRWRDNLSSNDLPPERFLAGGTERKVHQSVHQSLQAHNPKTSGALVPIPCHTGSRRA